MCTLYLSTHPWRWQLRDTRPGRGFARLRCRPPGTRSGPTEVGRRLDRTGTGVGLSRGRCLGWFGVLGLGWPGTLWLRARILSRQGHRDVFHHDVDPTVLSFRKPDLENPVRSPARRNLVEFECDCRQIV